MKKKHRRKVKALAEQAIREAPEIEPWQVAGAVAEATGYDLKEVQEVIRDNMRRGIERAEKVLRELQDS